MSSSAALPIERARARISAYVYGNILVLGAILSATPHTVEDGHAVVVVLATTVTTYLAHVVAHAVGAALTDAEHGPEPAFGPEELRDALPILSSGSAPAIILFIGAVTEFDPARIEAIAAGVVVVRLVGIGFVADRLGAVVRRRWSWASGLVLAGVSVVIVVLKLAFAH